MRKRVALQLRHPCLCVTVLFRAPGPQAGKRLGRRHLHKILTAVGRDCLQDTNTTEEKVQLEIYPCDFSCSSPQHTFGSPGCTLKQLRFDPDRAASTTRSVSTAEAAHLDHAVTLGERILTARREHVIAPPFVPLPSPAMPHPHPKRLTGC